MRILLGTKFLLVISHLGIYLFLSDAGLLCRHKPQ